MKTDLHAVDSPKKQTSVFVLFAFLLFKAKKSNLYVCFLGESTAHQSAFWFYLTFSMSQGIWKLGECTFRLHSEKFSTELLRFNEIFLMSFVSKVLHCLISMKYLRTNTYFVSSKKGLAKRKKF